MISEIMIGLGTGLISGFVCQESGPSFFLLWLQTTFYMCSQKHLLSTM